MACYVAYGTAISTSLDLGSYLGTCVAARYSMELSKGSHELPDSGLQVRRPLGPGHGRKLAIITDRNLATSEPGQPWCFEVADVVRFHWQGRSCIVRYEPLEGCNQELLAFWFIHIFLPLYLTLEGLYEIIHACAVEVNGDTVLFTAPSHGGKSTLTDYFLGRGHVLVSDDKVVTFCENGVFNAVPSHPNHRPYRRFEDLGRRVMSYSGLPRPIDTIYVLAGVDADSAVRVEEIRGHTKFAQVLPNYMFDFGYKREERLNYLARLLGSVPVYRVDVPWDLERLDEVYSAILRHREHL